MKTLPSVPFPPVLPFEPLRTVKVDVVPSVLVTVITLLPPSAEEVVVCVTEEIPTPFFPGAPGAPSFTTAIVNCAEQSMKPPQETLQKKVPFTVTESEETVMAFFFVVTIEPWATAVGENPDTAAPSLSVMVQV